MTLTSNEFLKKLAFRIKESKDEVTPSSWICKNTTLKSLPYSFAGHEFQRAIVDDMHPYLCVKKLSQVGLTECSIRKSVHFLHSHPGTSVLYTFPDLEMKKRNAQTRIKPIFSNDFPCENDEIRSISIMQLGQSYLYVATNVEGDATSTPVDVIINDEYDLSDMEFIALVNSRIQHSSFKIKQKFSTPTFQGYGISLEYESSDQREYFIKCPHCNHWHVPLYDTQSVYIPNLPSRVTDLKTDIDKLMASTLDFSNSYVRCRKCLKPLDLGDSSEREWVAKYPERYNSRGYWVRPFSSNLLSIDYLVSQMADFLQKQQIRRGVNTVLGEEYSDNNSRMELSDIEQAFENPKPPEVTSPVYLGLDMGMTCHLTLVSGDDVVYFEAIHQSNVESRVSEILKEYKVIGGAVDRHPFIPTSENLRNMSNGIIQPVVYSGNKRASPFREADGSISYYNIDRTAALDAVQQKINRHKLKFYGYGNYKEIITSHLRDMYRDDSPDKAPTWVKMNGNDHFFHSLGYAFVAKEIKMVEEYLRDVSTLANNTSIAFGGDFMKPVDNFDLLNYNTNKKSVIIKSRGW